jgi:hypothetical protein
VEPTVRQRWASGSETGGPSDLETGYSCKERRQCASAVPRESPPYPPLSRALAFISAREHRTNLVLLLSCGLIAATGVALKRYNHEPSTADAFLVAAVVFALVSPLWWMLRVSESEGLRRLVWCGDPASLATAALRSSSLMPRHRAEVAHACRRMLCGRGHPDDAQRHDLMVRLAPLLRDAAMVRTYPDVILGILPAIRESSDLPTYGAVLEAERVAVDANLCMALHETRTAIEHKLRSRTHHDSLVRPCVRRACEEGLLLRPLGTCPQAGERGTLITPADCQDDVRRQP